MIGKEVLNEILKLELHLKMKANGQEKRYHIEMSYSSHDPQSTAENPTHYLNHSHC